jgi:hypothetical protein
METPEPKPRRTCDREGCDQRSNRRGEKQYCSSVCCIADNELAKTQRVCEAVGPSPSSSELWAAAAALNDAVTEYHRLHNELFGVARSVGITEDAWLAIKRGG